VLVVDDEGLMRAGLVELLSSDPDIEVVGEAATGREAVREAGRLRPDVVLMDVRMPDMDGIAATAVLVRSTPSARVLILTTFEDEAYIFDSLRAGASGFLLKRSRPEELIAGVHAVAAGDSLLSPSVTRRVINRMAQPAFPGLRRVRAGEQPHAAGAGGSATHRPRTLQSRDSGEAGGR
jgi:DNA-binding NarL/FixJ family response regulator